MYCPYCGKEGIDKSNYCPACGGDLRRLGEEAEYQCSACKGDVGEDAKYCMSCGEKLEEAENIESDEGLKNKAADAPESLIKNTKKKSTNINFRSVIAAFIGLALYTFFGITIVFPVVLVVICYLVARKIVKRQAKTMLVAFSIQVGHIIWMIVGFVLLVISASHFTLDSSLAIMIVQIVAIGLGSIWLITRPGLSPVLFLTATQVAMFVINLNTLNSIASLTYEYGPTFKSLIIHLILRASAVISMFVGLYYVRKGRIVG